MARELIRLDDVHRAFGPLTVLEGINLRIDEGDRIGVVGHNGAGKTTLLRTISNQDQDLGDVTYAAGLRLAFLTQIRDIVEEATLGEELNRRGRQFQELEDEISKIVRDADNIKVHKDGDVILMDSLDESKTDKEKMKCNSPRRIRKGEAGHGKKKFVVKACDGGTEKIIRYGDANMEIKKDSPARRKSFRARHNCKNPGSKLKARYWSCKKW